MMARLKTYCLFLDVQDAYDAMSRNGFVEAAIKIRDKWGNKGMLKKMISLSIALSCSMGICSNF